MSGIAFRNSARLFQEDRNIVYHYTDVDAFNSILQTGELRLTHVRYLNDSRELYEGLAFFEDYLRNFEHSSLTANQNALVRHLKTHLSIAGFDETYASCFSRQGDLLSQWRSYADGGHGVAIGFDRQILRALDTDWAPNGTTYGEVRYGDVHSKELSQRLIRVVSRYSHVISKGVNLSRGSQNMSPEARDSFFNDAAYQIMGCVTDEIAFVKPSAFEEEEEERLILRPFGKRVGRRRGGRRVLWDNTRVINLNDQAPKERHFRKTSRGLTPYVCIKIPPDCIRRVVLGPLASNDESIYAINLLLESARARLRESIPGSYLLPSIEAMRSRASYR